MTPNSEQNQYDNEQVHRDAKKALILEALKDGPAFADGLAKRLGERSNKEFVSLLHEIVDNDEISFTWLRGYKL